MTRIASARPRFASGVVERLETRQLFAAPTIDAIGSRVATVGKTLQLPITATADAGRRLTYTVTDNSASVTTYVRPASNSWLRMDVEGFGAMTFELFDDVAPETVRRIKGLVQSGFYDGLTFHRIVQDFVVQGGDPDGDGTGGPQFRFDDEFDPNVLFTGRGQLAMANSGKDTNGSQFFITSASSLGLRNLDFNHTIFGQLVRGFETFSAVDEVPVDEDDRPLSPVVITKASIVSNATDAVLQVRTTDSDGGLITVTATDDSGQSVSQRFRLTGAADDTNTPPILAPVPADVTAATNTPVTLTLGGVDLEGDEIAYGATYVLQNGASGAIDGNTVTITPAAGFVGEVQIIVGVAAKNATSRGSTPYDEAMPLGGIYDTQIVTISFGDAPPDDVVVYEASTVGVLSKTVLLGSFLDSDASAKGSEWGRTSVDWGDGTVSTIGDDVRIEKSSKDRRFYVYGTHTYGNGVDGAIPVTLNLRSKRGATQAVQGSIRVRPLARLAGGVVSVNGTDDADQIGVSSRGGKYRFNVNGAVVAYNVADVSRIEIDAWAGNDKLAVGGNVIGVYANGNDGDDTLDGGDGSDTLSAGAGRNVLSGLGGNDRLNGSGGRDYLIGGIGDDRLYGNGGSDTLDGQAGVDRMWGGDGTDLLFGGGSNDKLYGEAGNDTIYGQAGADYIEGGGGIDACDSDDDDVNRIGIEELLSTA